MDNKRLPANPLPNPGLLEAMQYSGLTKFEKVAAMAMQGFAASADEKYGTPQEVAKDGIAAAHAFFKELEEQDESLEM